MKIAVGSLNPAKVNAIRSVFENKMDVMAIDVESGVSAQPFSDEETIQGALNRAENCLQGTDADFGAGLEGGVVDTEYGMFVCNWGVLAARTGERYIAGGARVLLPETVAEQLRKGAELGPVMDAYTRKTGIRKKEGAIGVFTNNRVSRAGMFTHLAEMLAGQYEYRSRYHN